MMKLTIPRQSCRPLVSRKQIRTVSVRSAAPETSAKVEGSTPPANVCKKCGVDLAEVPWGCDQDGHRVGGVGMVFEWWPIKAWGPCPKAAAAGIPYTRKGQGTDEMLFGGDEMKR